MFDFKNIFVFDLANNHQGDVNHALKIIEECSHVSKKEMMFVLRLNFSLDS